MEVSENGPAAFADRARQMTAQWDRSEAARLVRPDPGRGPGHAGVTGLTAVSADGRTLTLRFIGGVRDTA